jgi:hypothetical protein
VLRVEGAKPVLLVAGGLFEGGWRHQCLHDEILLLAGEKPMASSVSRGAWPL